MEPRRPGTNPLADTKRNANDSVNRKKRYLQIIEILSESTEPLSAKEIAVEMYKRGYSSTSERNLSHPRIHELLEKNVLDNPGTKVCEYSGKTVGVFELRKGVNIFELI